MTPQMPVLWAIALLAFGCVGPTDEAPEEVTRPGGKTDGYLPPAFEDETFEGRTRYYGDLETEMPISISADAGYVRHEWELAVSGPARVLVETDGDGRPADTVIWVFQRQADRSWSTEPVDGGHNDDDPRFEGLVGSFVDLALDEGEYLVVVETFDEHVTRAFSLVSSCAGEGCTLDGPSCQRLDRHLTDACDSTEPDTCFVETPWGDVRDAATACCDRYQHAWCF